MIFTDAHLAQFFLSTKQQSRFQQIWCLLAVVLRLQKRLSPLEVPKNGNVILLCKCIKIVKEKLLQMVHEGNMKRMEGAVHVPESEILQIKAP